MAGSPVQQPTVQNNPSVVTITLPGTGQAAGGMSTVLSQFQCTQFGLSGGLKLDAHYTHINFFSAKLTTTPPLYKQVRWNAMNSH